MNERMIEIVQKLLQNDWTIASFAKEFSVSERTIRNDIHTINDWLKINGFNELELPRGGKILKKEDFFQTKELLAEMNLTSYHLSKLERKVIASALIISATDFITISQIADHLMVSRVTIINDLDEIKAFIRKGKLEVVSQPNRGLRVDGLESKKRILLMHISEKYAKNEVIMQHLPLKAGDSVVIQKILLEQETNHNIHLNDYSFQRLLVYLGIMLNRNLQGYYLEVQNHGDNEKYIFAQDILKYVTQYCGIHTTQDEVLFLSHFLNKLRYTSEKNANNNFLKVQIMTRRFINEISEDLEVDLNGDYEFYENLSNHLESVLKADASAFPENEIIDNVLQDYPEAVNAVKKNLSIISNHLDRQLTNVEIGYIVVHVCAALERKKNSNIAFRVVIACHAGIGTSRLLLERLKQHFNFHIVDIISSHEASKIPESSADLVISTVPLKDCKIESITVSPLLGDDDYIRVGNKVDLLRNSRNLPTRIESDVLSAKGLLEQLNPIFYNLAPEYADELSTSVRKVVRSYFHKSLDANEDIFSPYLHHLLPISHIQLDVECKDWKDAIYQSALPLLEMGYIEERYIDAMIHNIEENGPYVVISKGFAVPHEGLDCGSLKVGMNLIRLKTPVPFDADENDPVRYVCCLSAADHKTHLKAFFNLVNMLRNESFKKKLDEAKTPKEISSIIEQYEYTVM